MLRPSIVASALLGALFTSIPASAQYRVAVVASGSATSAEAAAQLNDDTFFDFDAVVVNPDAIDDATELSAFDVVVWGDSGNHEQVWTLAMAVAVKAWAEAKGGGVVSTSWVPYALRNDPTELAMDDLTPIDAAPDATDFWCSPPDSNTPLEVTVLANHPVVEGMTSIMTNSEFVNYSPLPPDGTNVILLGEIANATNCNAPAATHPAIAVGELGVGRTAYTGFLYQANVGYDLGDVRDGDRDRLLEQAVHWAAGKRDTDGDTVINEDDNCPFVVNLDQLDNESDGLGDPCDDDDDNDTVLDVVDNCPLIANVDQTDTDLDNIGDACDVGGSGGSGGSGGMAGSGGMGGAMGGMGGSPNGGMGGLSTGGMGAGGSPTTSSGGTPVTPADAADDKGCGCTVVGESQPATWGAIAMLGAAWSLGRRRRRRAR